MKDRSRPKNVLSTFVEGRLAALHKDLGSPGEWKEPMKEEAMWEEGDLLGPLVGGGLGGAPVASGSGDAAGFTFTAPAVRSGALGLGKGKRKAECGQSPEGVGTRVRSRARRVVHTNLNEDVLVGNTAT